jgi:rhamnogalacturonan endolyase
MATNNQGTVDPGELRFLARLRTSELPTGVHGDVGDTRGCTAIEGKDTFKCPNGHTSCKMYTSDRFIDDKLHCVSGSVGVIYIYVKCAGLMHSRKPKYV